MKKSIMLIALGIALLFWAGNLIASEPMSVKEIKDALTPKTKNMNRSYKPQNQDDNDRGLEGTRPELPTPPQVTMRLQFHLNSAELRAEDIPPLQNLGKALQDEALKNYVYVIEGHTCDLGKDAYNLRLSQQRALTVRDFLVSRYGLSVNQFEVVGYGRHNPETPNTDEAARQKNRRGLSGIR